jgi:CRISPR-associated exonuclease Cas4
MSAPLPLAPPDSDGYPPLSALNDLLFCPRRCALHRLEGLWRENVHTTAGSLDHRRVHRPRDRDESPYRTARGLWIVSHRLRLVGVADLVEFHPDPLGGRDVPYPVEYKRGRRRRWDNDEVQLCAQAFALEELLGVTVLEGAIYHILSKRRRVIVFDAALRHQTEEAAARLHALLASGATPPPILHPKCRQCSVRDLCLPDLVVASARYRQAANTLFEVAADDS